MCIAPHPCRIPQAFVCNFTGQPLYPIVGIDMNHPVEMNFGVLAPFVFNVQEYENAAWERARQLWRMDQSGEPTDEPPLPPHLNMRSLVCRNLEPLPAAPTGEQGEVSARAPNGPAVSVGGGWEVQPVVEPSEEWQATRAMLLQMFQSVGQLGGMGGPECHFEWQGQRLVLMPGPVLCLIVT